MTEQTQKPPLRFYMMTSLENIYRIDAKTRNNASAVDGDFCFDTQCLLQESEAEQSRYLNAAIRAGYYAWSPQITRDEEVRLKVTLYAEQGVVKPFDRDSYSSGLAYALACSLYTAVDKKWCESEDIPDIPYFCTGRVSESGAVGKIGELTKKVSEAVKYCESASDQVSRSPGNPSFIILVPDSNYDRQSEALLGEEVDEQQRIWSDLISRVKKLNGKVVAISTVGEALKFILADAYTPAWKESRDCSPVGLQAIDYAHRHHFFGRSQKVVELLDSAERAYNTASALTVIGSSGLGKSSLVQAGLLPALMKSHPNLTLPKVGKECYLAVKPSNFLSFIDYLAALLLTLTPDKGQVGAWLASPLNELSDIVIAHLNAQPDFPFTVWILDQYEELFHGRLISADELNAFNQLLREIAATQKILVITVVRLEYHTHSGVVAGERFTLLEQHKAAEFKNIIEEHCAYFGVDMAFGDSHAAKLTHRQHLQERILGDVSQAPLSSLALLLQKLFEAMQAQAATSGLYCHCYYDELGGIDGVMTGQAELALQEGLAGVPQALHESLTCAFFDALVSVNEDNKPVISMLPSSQIKHYRAREASGEYSEQSILPLIDAFMAKGLLSDSDHGSKTQLRFVHDTLLNIDKSRPYWFRLAAWFEARVDYLKWERSSYNTFQRWIESQRGTKYLLRDKEELKAAKAQLVSTNNIELREFIRLSSARQRSQFQFTVLGALGIIVAIAAFGWGVNERYTELEAKALDAANALENEKKSRREVIELEIKSELMILVANMGLYVPDDIVIDHTDLVRKIIRDRSTSLSEKQQALNDIPLMLKPDSQSKLSGKYASNPSIIQDLNDKNFHFNRDSAISMPELYRRILETESMEEDEKQYWFDILPNMTDNQVDRLYNILETERQRFNELEEKFQKEIKALNEKHLIEWKDFKMKSNGIKAPEDPVKELLAEAKLLKNEDIQASISKAHQLLSIEEKENNITWISLEAHWLLGDSYKKLGEFEKALEHYLSELTLRDELSIPLRNDDLYNQLWEVGNAYINLELFDKAVEFYRRAIHILDEMRGEENAELDYIDRKSAHLWRNIATSCLVIGNKDDAISAMVNSIELSGNKVEYTSIPLSDDNLKIRLLHDLIDMFKDIIELEKYDNDVIKRNIASINGSLSWYYLLVNKPVEAESSGNRALRIAPDMLWVKTNVAHAYLLQNKYEKARRIYRFNAKKQVNSSKVFYEAVLDDFEILKKKGIYHKEMDKIKAEFESVKP